MGYKQNNIFQESDLQFQFSDTDWRVKKYDTHRFFKTLSGAGLKGVDFLGIFQDKQVVLWEVKNYHTNQANKSQNYLIVENTVVFIENIIGKVTDTLTAIRVIQQYLNRQWWYRFYSAYSSYIPTFLIRQKDWFFWHQIQKISKEKGAVTFVLWLEIEASLEVKVWKKILTTIQQELSKQLKKEDISLVIASINQPYFGASLQVSQQKK